MADYKPNFLVGWSGPHERIPDSAKNRALAGLMRMAAQTPVTRAGIVRFGQQAHAWYARNRHPFMVSHPQVSIGTLFYTLYNGPLQIAEINIVTGEVLYIVSSLK